VVSVYALRAGGGGALDRSILCTPGIDPAQGTEPPEAALPDSLALPIRQGLAHERQSGLDIALDQRRREAEDAISEASERGVPARVSRRTPSVVLAIDLDHESRLRRDEVGDVAAEHDLPAKRYAEA